MADDDLDDILSSALDDLEEDNNDDSGSQHADLGNAVKAAAEASAKSAQEGGEAAAAAAASGGAGDLGMGFDLSDMQEVLKELQDGDLGKVLEAALKMPGGEEGGDDGEENPLLAAMRAAGAAGGEGGGAGDEQTAKLLQMLAQSSGAAEGTEPQLDDFAENLMGQVAQEFESMAGKDDFESFMGGMMKQLLSRDVMYTPLKQVCDKFPEWLADNQPKISEEEYTRYGKQYQIYQRAVATYETEGDNSERVAELLQDAQDLGQLPADLIKDLAPGLEFGSDGLPVMPNMGPGVMPPNAELMENCKQQ